LPAISSDCHRIAIVTFLAWFLPDTSPAFTYAFLNFVAVLVIGLPLRIGPGTATAIFVGTGKGLNTVFFPQRRYTRTSAQNHAVLLDKTGT